VFHIIFVHTRLGLDFLFQCSLSGQENVVIVLIILSVFYKDLLNLFSYQVNDLIWMQLAMLN